LGDIFGHNLFERHLERPPARPDQVSIPEAARGAPRRTAQAAKARWRKPRLDARDAIFAGNIKRNALPDIGMARTWYEKAKEHGSTEAAERLQKLAARDGEER
jgi:hypothetical protein